MAVQIPPSVAAIVVLDDDHTSWRAFHINGWSGEDVYVLLDQEDVATTVWRYEWDRGHCAIGNLITSDAAATPPTAILCALSVQLAMAVRMRGQ